MTPNCSGRSRVRQRTAMLLLAMNAAGSVAAQSGSGLDVTVHATVLMSGFRNSGRFNNADVPTVALLGSGATARALGGTVRQTRVGFTAAHESVLGGRLFAEVDADFFGGQQPSGGGRTHPLLRIRRAYAEIRWPAATLLVGQESPALFGASPRSVAASGFPQLAAAGNLWLWLPQIRLTTWLGADPTRFRIGLEGAVMAPNGGEPVDPFLTQPDIAEQSGRPNLEGRLLARWRQSGRDGEIGIGGHLGWVGPVGARVTSRAVGGSVIAPLGSFFELRGEVFVGEALAGLGGGGIGQNLSAGEPVETQGGWVQAVLFPNAELEIGVSGGIDDPDDAVLLSTARFRNRAVAANVTWRRAPVVAGIEFRRITTDYLSPDPIRARGSQFQLGLGIEF